MENKKYEQKTCNICGKSALNGIMIRKGFICTNCERQIVHIKCNDEKYKIIKNNIKEIIYK